VAQALVNLMHFTQAPGTFSLPGPVSFTLEYLLEFVQSVAYLPPSRVPYLPKSIMLAMARLAQLPWFPMVSPDELERRYINDADVEGDWDAFGVRPAQIEDHALGALRRFRSACVLWVASVRNLVIYLSSFRDNFTRPLVIPPRALVSLLSHTAICPMF
jgi:NADH dehydrogenase (ubiquinone) 1 alpha subcomplex subunit 9